MRKFFCTAFREEGEGNNNSTLKGEYMFCEHCSREIHHGLEFENNGRFFCDKSCMDGETLPVQEELFDEADLISREHNELFSNWEKVARKEV